MPQALHRHCHVSHQRGSGTIAFMGESTATLSIGGDAGGDLGARCYLLVMEGDSTSVYHLPDDGVVLIGRGDEADLALRDPVVSRRHARLVLSSGEVRVVDLDSHNGTVVNGEIIAGARVLASGDTMSICGATLVLHRGRSAHVERTVLDPEPLRQRLEQERARALAYGRPLALACLRIERGSQAPSAVVREVLGQVRLIDVLGRDPSGGLVLLLPELDADTATETVRALLSGLGERGLPARAGLAIAGVDGSDSDTLIAIARGAADVAGAGEVSAGASACHRLAIGDRTVLVADPAMGAAYALLRRLAASELPVLVLGETGVGKENAAFAAHAWSPRAAGPFITVNCAAIPEALFESELFGYERGAFSGAVQAKAGLLEAAHGGTLFLDEIGELPLLAQPKLLRVLELGKLMRLGDLRERPVNLRLVAATNRDLEAEVSAGRFRRDLYFRLGAATVILPPLRDRPREIPILAREFLGRAAGRLGQAPCTLSPRALERITAHDWSGNVRELKNTMEYAAATAIEGVVEPWHLPPRVAGRIEAPPAAAKPDPTFRPIAAEIEELERRRISEALAAADGLQTRAAELISMSLRTFQQRLKDYGIARRRS
jgi:two-component system response regulator AtoC